MAKAAGPPNFLTPLALPTAAGRLRVAAAARLRCRRNFLAEIPWPATEARYAQGLSKLPRIAALMLALAGALAAQAALSARAQGEAAYRRGDWNQARQALTLAIQQAPADAGAHALLGLTLARLGDRSAALAQLDRAAALAPTNADYSYDRALILLALGRAREAIAPLEALRREHPAAADVTINLARAYAASGARELLARLAASLPPALCNDNTLLEQVSQLAAAAHAPEAAVGLWRRVLALDPGRELAYAALTEVFLGRGQLQQAEALLAGAPQAARGPAFLYARGQLGLARGDYGGAAADFAAVIRRLPGRRSAWIGRLEALSLARHDTQALAAAQEAEGRFPGDEEFRYREALADYMLDRVQPAAAALRTALERQPDDARAVLLLAVVAGEQGDFATAERNFQRLPRLLPGCDALGHYFYGALLLRRDQSAGAARELRAALACRPVFPIASVRLAQALDRSRQPQAALRQARAATQQAPGLATAWFWQARLEREVGETAAARASMARFQALNARQDAERDLLRAPR